MFGIHTRSLIGRALWLGLFLSAATSSWAETLFVVTSTNQLIRYDSSATPATADPPILITGLQGGETIVGIDFRPADGQLYALGSTSRLYTIDLVTAVATQVGTGQFATLLNGTAFGFDFNPVPDRIRVVSDADQNLRLNPNDGTIAGVDTTLAYVSGDPGPPLPPADPTIVASAYTNNVPGATTTTLYGIETATGALVRQGSAGGTPSSPNAGQLTTIGALGFMPADALVGFDIAASGTAFLVADPGTGDALYTVDLTTGAATLVGALGGLSGADVTAFAAINSVFNFSAPSVIVNENAGTVSLTVNRIGQLETPADVVCTTTNGTATAPDDYTTTQTTLTFIAGDPSETCVVPIIDDVLTAGLVGFNVTLSMPTGGVVLGGTSRSGVVIVDNEVPSPTMVGAAANGSLVRFNSAAPGTILGTIPVTGLQASETINGIDYRPATGELYALGSTSALYVVNPTAGTATGFAPFSPVLNGTTFGFDFNPTVDRIRVVSDADQNFRLNPATGALAGTDTALSFAPGDANVGQDPNVAAVAYTNSFSGTATTTLYGIDFGRDVLVRQGGPDGAPSPNGGVLSTIGALGVDVTGVLGFDIVPNGPAFALLQVGGGTPSLYLINLTNGTTVLIGAVGGTSPVQHMAFDPNVDSDLDLITDLYEIRFGLNPLVADAAADPDNDGQSSLQEFQGGTHPRGFFTRYLAEGATSDFFDASFALLNPGAASATVLMRFQKSDGTQPSQFVSLPGLRRATVNAKSVSGLAVAEFSTLVESDVAVVVDRTMTFDSTGYGSHAETSVAAPSTIWYLAEGATTFNFNLFYLLQNPGDTAADVEITYLRPAPEAPFVLNYTVPAHTRFNVWVNLIPELTEAEISAVVQSDVPIIVERAMYLDAGGQLFSAGHDSAGVVSPALNWYFGEGATGNFFDTFILLENPNPSDAEVTILYLLFDGTTVSKDYVVSANSRHTVWVDFEDPKLANTAVASSVSSTNGVGIIAERAMWFPGPTADTWNEAHNSPGATATGTIWALAEGEVGGTRASETYILISNTGPTLGTVRVTLYFEDGTSAERVFNVLANSRFNVNVLEDFPAAVNRRFATIVASEGPSPAPLVVERSVYTAVNGVPFVAATNALGTRLQ